MQVLERAEETYRKRPSIPSGGFLGLANFFMLLHVKGRMPFRSSFFIDRNGIRSLNSCGFSLEQSLCALLGLRPHHLHLRVPAPFVRSFLCSPHVDHLSSLDFIFVSRWARPEVAIQTATAFGVAATYFLLTKKTLRIFKWTVPDLKVTSKSKVLSHCCSFLLGFLGFEYHMISLLDARCDGLNGRQARPQGT